MYRVYRVYYKAKEHKVVVYATQHSSYEACMRFIEAHKDFKPKREYLIEEQPEPIQYFKSK